MLKLGIDALSTKDARKIISPIESHEPALNGRKRSFFVCSTARENPGVIRMGAVGGGADMRLAIVTTSYPKSEDDPAGHFVRAEARAFEREGHDVVVFAPGGDAFGWPGLAARVRERPWRVWSAASELGQLRARVKAARVDRVIAHWCVPSAFPLSLGLRVELEVVSHGGDVRLLRALPGVVRTAVVSRLATDAVLWRFVSQTLLDDLLATLPPDVRARVEGIAKVQACAIEMPDVRAAVARHRSKEPKKRLAVCVARLVESKRVDRVIEHVAREEAGTALVVVGDGPERERLVELARKRRIDARFVGQLPRPEALAWIGAADVLLHASRTEGLSTVLREASALGVRAQFVGA